MTDKQIEALKLALECVEAWDRGCDRDTYWRDIDSAKGAFEQALKAYTTPPQRKPLTDEQWQVIADTLGCLITRSQKDVIEATLGITGEQK